MRLEFEPKSSAAVPFVENEVAGQSAASEVERMFREGVRAAQEGRRAEARNLLLGVTEADADNENAWLWLASISEYPEELLVFLNHVLRINPRNERALEWNRATKSLLAKTLVQRGMDAAGENRPDFARQCFEQALEHELENETAWLWMASLAASEDEQSAYYERVLSINPENETAGAALRAFARQKTQKYFHEALEAAFDGRHAEAQALLETVLSRDPEMEDAWVLKSHLAGSFEERAECFLKLRAVNPENEMANANLVSWRSLAEMVAARRPQTEEKPAPAVAEDAREEEAAAGFSNEAPAAEFSEYSLADAENDAAAHSVSEDGAPAADYFVRAENDAAVFAAATPVDEDFAGSERPTEELSFDTDRAQPESMSFGEPEQSRAGDEQNYYAEYRAEEVRFETEENQAAEAQAANDSPQNLRAALEAEEAEMSWAFSGTPSEAQSKEAEDYFRSYDDADDIHKTQQANYEAEDFAPAFSNDAESFAPTFSNDVEALAETTVAATAVAEDWRDASPSVFFNYSPVAAENSFEASTVHFSYAENPAAEETSPGVYEAAEAEAPSETAAEENYFLQFVDHAALPQDADRAAQTGAESVREEMEMSAAEAVEPQPEEKPVPARAESVLCPFCDAANDKQAFFCGSCQTVLTLSDLEMLLSQQNANAEKLRLSVESMERENESYGLSAEQMTNLGVGHVNLKNYRQGFLYLQEAVRMNPSNVLLDAQVNALAIRLSEMEEQQTAHDAMAKNRKILVVDDSPTVRKLISGKLEKCGHEVVCAVDGVDALEKINQLCPDLVLLDITMPRMDGYQVCKMIRSNESTKDVPVVMISGKDGFFDKVRGRMAGTSGYITKPFGPETFMKTVETYLN